MDEYLWWPKNNKTAFKYIVILIMCMLEILLKNIKVQYRS